MAKLPKKLGESKVVKPLPKTVKLKNMKWTTTDETENGSVSSTTFQVVKSVYNEKKDRYDNYIDILMDNNVLEKELNPRLKPGYRLKEIDYKDPEIRSWFFEISGKAGGQVLLGFKDGYFVYTLNKGPSTKFGL